MKNKPIYHDDLSKRDNVNKEKAVNSYRMQKLAKSSKLTLGVCLGFFALTLTSVTLLAMGVFPLTAGIASAITCAIGGTTSAVIYAKKTSNYLSCIEEEEKLDMAEREIENRKLRQERHRQLKEERERKEKQKEACKKKPKVVKLVKHHSKNEEKTQFKNKPTPALATSKEEQIKAIKEFLDGGK